MEVSKVLVVEDDPVSRLIISKYLENLNLETCFANNGQEAIVKVYHKGIQLVLMDIDMPKIKGNDATEAIRNMDDPYFKNIPIIAVTGMKNVENAGLDFSENGFNDYIAKPISAKSLELTIGKFIPIEKQSA